MINIGVLALQGDFKAHISSISRLGAHAQEVKTPEQLESLDGLVIPGGESSTLLKLLNTEFRAAIMRFASHKPILATCAGCILVAELVSHPEQDSLKLLPIHVKRNAYGRQIDSFITNNLKLSLPNTGETSKCEGIFIRAPKIEKVNGKTCILASLDGAPVAVQYNNTIGITFHPELSEELHPIYTYFLTLCLGNNDSLPGHINAH